MTEMRYDGPDLEADTSGRMQGLLMASVMAADGAHSGHANAQHRAEQRRTSDSARAEQQDRALWAGVPTGDWPELDDNALAVRWQATARHCGDRGADAARGAIEQELTARDPDTMRDYRSWRYAAGCTPGTAMQQALAERERRLASSWQPLSDSRGAGLDESELTTSWVAALGAHDPAAQHAIEAGAQQLRARLPELMADYDTARARLTPTAQGQWVPGQVTPHAAAAQATGHRLAFGPGTAWTQTLQHGTPQPTSAQPALCTPTRPTAAPTPANRLLAAHSAATAARP